MFVNAITTVLVIISAAKFPSCESYLSLQDIIHAVLIVIMAPAVRFLPTEFTLEVRLCLFGITPTVKKNT